MSVTFTQEEFKEKALELLKLSALLHDTWRIDRKENSQIVLVKNEKIVIESVAESDNDDPSALHARSKVFAVEYHVLLHPSYQVPTLYFNAYRDDRLIELDDVSILFADDYGKSKYEIHNIVSQAEHPTLFRPFFMIHPCKIGEVLSMFPHTRNFILTFLTIFGPSVRLKMSCEYEKFFRE